MNKIISTFILIVLFSACKNHSLKEAMALADTYYDNGRLNQALKIYNQIIEKDDSFAIAYARRGSLYNVAGDYLKAERDLLYALSLDSLNSEYLVVLGAIKENNEDYTNALKCYDKAITIDSNYAAFNNLGMYYMKNNRYELSLEYFDAAIMVNPDSSMIFNNRATLKEKMKNSHGAILDYSIAISLDSLVDIYYYNRAVSKYSIKDMEGTILDLSKAIELNPAGLYYYYRGMVYQKTDMHKRSCEDLFEAVNRGYQAAEKELEAKNCK